MVWYIGDDMRMRTAHVPRGRDLATLPALQGSSDTDLDVITTLIETTLVLL